MKQYMRIAIREAEASLREGNHGFGAVVLKGDAVIARADDTEETDRDPTAHGDRRRAAQRAPIDTSVYAVVDGRLKGVVASIKTLRRDVFSGRLHTA